MPVIDLADYLGMPAQAPANPVFNQTRKSTGVASLDREVEDFYKGAAAIDQLRSLQRQAPVFEAQKAQIAYDKVAQDARDLRMKQEIEAQVERAANELAGGNLNPESEDFGAKYRDLATRNPLAFSDPRFSDVAGLYAAQNQNYQAARKQQMDAERAAAAKANEELQTAIGGFLEYGGDANLVPSIKSVQQAKYLEGQMRKAAREAVGTRGGAKDVAGQAKQKDFELVSSEIDKMEKLGKSVLYDKDGAEIPNPKFDKLVEEYDRLFNELRGSYRGIYSPAQTPVAATKDGTVIPFRPPEAPKAAAPFRQTMKDLAAPKAENILKVDESEVLQGINDPSADENTYMAAISDPNVSLKVKEKALSNLRDYVNNPKPKTFADFTEGLQYAEKLENNLKDAEIQFSMEKDRSVANPVWDNVKSVMDSKVKEVAKKLNMTTDTLLNSLIKNEVLSGDKVGPEIVAKYGNVRSNEVATRNIFKALSKVDWRNKIPSFEPLKKLPNAYDLGLSSGKTWNDVFESYIDEKKSRSPSQSPQPAQESIVEISTEEEVDALPKGTKFRGSDGEVRRK
jgi:hypothetical protein